MTRPAKPRGRVAIGCDVGGTEVKWAVLERRRILERGSFPTPRRGEPVALIEGLLRTARQAAGAHPDPRPVLGVAIPGYLDDARARLLHAVHLPLLEEKPLRAVLRRRLGWPVYLETDSNAGAFGEAILGAGRGARRVLYITLGTGVGASMVVDGKILRVSHHTVGQVAHLPLDPRGPRCTCGSRGCFESVLGARGLGWRAARAGGPDGLPPAARRSPRELCLLARGGSRPAREVLAEVGRLLGAGLAMLSNFLSPDRIVVGGGIAGAGELLLAPAREVFRRRVHPRLRGGIELAPSRLGPFSGAAGAAVLARELADGPEGD
jgi:glucokinase